MTFYGCLIKQYLGHHPGNLVSWNQWKGDGHGHGIPRKVDVSVTDAAAIPGMIQIGYSHDFVSGAIRKHT